jgi:phospholipid/cholesterol/gamma-HCH transport system substrate-binding protein
MPPAADGAVPAAAPSSFGTGGSGPGPSVAVAQYNPHTGMYVTPDGRTYRQSDLVAPAAPKSWKDMLPT